MADQKVVGVTPDISEVTFTAVLKAANSPALSAAHAVYQYCVKRGVSASFLLAMFQHESSLGKAGTATITHSWGNTRMPTHGGVTPVRMTTAGEARSGTFPVFRDWIDGGIATVARFVDYAPYQGKTTVGQIIPTWAPASDGNNAALYVRNVLAQMTAWQTQDKAVAKGGDVTAGQIAGGLGGGKATVIAKPPMVISHTPSKFGYSKGTRQQLMICDHITAAGKGGYSRDTPSLPWLRDEIEGSPSVNFLIGRSGVTVEIVPPDGPAPWTNGIDYSQYPNGKRPNMANPIIADITRRQISPNQVCVTIEHEAENGGDMNAAQWAASIKLHIWLCWRFKIAPDTIHIVGHNQWDGIDRPYCPGWTEAQWANLRAQIAAGLGAAGKVPLNTDEEDDMQLPAPGTAETRIAPDGTPYVIWNAGGKAKKVLGTNIQNIGISVENDQGDKYDRSILNNEAQPWHKR